MKKQISFLLAVFLVLPLTLAQAPPEPEASCSLFSPLQCLREAAYLITYATGLAAQPLIKLIETLMTKPPSVNVFQTVWKAITGIISLFYIFFLLYAGIVFLTQGDDVVKRHEAKEAIKSMVFVLVFVASSFYTYTLLIDLNASLTSYVFAQINPDFFTVTSESFGNAILQILLIAPYVLVLLGTSIVLVGRWLFVSFGILLFPIGLFLSFVPFLKGYGKLIMHILLILIFLPFFSSIILLGSSLLVTEALFAHFSILFYMVAFLLVDFLFYLLIKFVIHKSALGEAAGLSKIAVALGKAFL